MSVVGIDFGNLNSVVAAARKRGIDVLANEASKRETPSVVAFRENQRYLGEKASTQQMSNLQNTITDFKVLLGRKWSQKEVQDLVPQFPFKLVEMPGDNIGVEVDYQNQTQIFSVEQVTAMMFFALRTIAEADSKGAIKLKELVVSVPTWWTDGQRRALKDATAIAGLNCHQLLSEPTAIAIPYGMYKKDLPDDDKPIHVLFVNFGHSSFSASAVAFSKTQLRILSSVYANVGGRDLDEALFRYFSEEVKTKHNIDISKNQRAQLRLRTQCERVKRVLTGINEAPIFVESIVADVDFRSVIKREDFENLLQPVFDEIEKAVRQAITDSGVESFSFVEVTGGSSYVPKFQTELAKITGVELSHTQNKTESIARGCAIQCAIISPQFHINRNVTVKDYVPYSISITLNDIGSNESKTYPLFKKGDALPSAKKITLKNKHLTGLEVSANYENPNELPSGFENLLNIGKFTIPKFEPTIKDAESIVTEVKFKLDASGIFYLDYARSLETYYEAEQVEPPKSTETKTDNNKSQENNKSNEPNANEKPTSPKDVDGDAVMNEQKKKKKTKATNLAVSGVYSFGLPSKQLQDLQEKESAMQKADQLAIETAEAKNALEGYAYDGQSKLSYDFSEWSPYATESERNQLLDSINSVITWLYGEGDDAPKATYETKLNELRSLGDTLELRRVEDETRPGAVEELKKRFEFYLAFVATTDEKYSHIGEEERKKVSDKVKEAQEWLSKMEEKQAPLSKTETPVLLTSSLNNKKSDLDAFCTPIINTPKPKPKEEPKKEEPKKEEPKTEESPKDETTPAATENKEETPSNPETNSPPEMPAPSDMDVD